MAEEQIKRLKAGKKQVDVANAFAEARAAKLADELAQLRGAPGQNTSGADAQHEQHMKDVAASEAQAEECKRLHDQVFEAVHPPGGGMHDAGLMPVLATGLRHAVSKWLAHKPY